MSDEFNILDDDFDELDDEDYFDCGQFVSDGVIYCSAAGSEDCDWDCPNRRELGKTLEELDEELEEKIESENPFGS